MTEEYPKYYNDRKVRVDADGRISFASMEAVQEYFSLPDVYYENIMGEDEK